MPVPLRKAPWNSTRRAHGIGSATKVPTVPVPSYALCCTGQISIPSTHTWWYSHDNVLLSYRACRGELHRLHRELQVRGGGRAHGHKYDCPGASRREDGHIVCVAS